MNVASAALLAFALAAHGRAASQPDPAMVPPLSGDETVVVFPSHAVQRRSGDTVEWVIPLRGWVFEREADSSWRNATIDEFGRQLGLSPREIASDLFRTRSRAFLYDNERGKRVVIRIGGQRVAMPETAENGHFHGEFRLTDAQLAAAAGTSGVVPLDVENAGAAEVVVAPARVARPEGVLVVCDLDDTLKVSNIGDTSALLRSALLEPYVAIPGMRELCARFADAGAELHYLSASPWQLYEPLRAFLRESGFPDGAITLREFRLKDRRILTLVEDPTEYKRAALAQLHERLPARRLVLVGDTSEQDAVIYASFAREHPGAVALIAIRTPPGGGALRERAEAALSGLPAGTRGIVFDDPSHVKPDAVPEAAPHPR